MKQKKTIQERTPVAGDVWWINKTTGAQDMHFIVQAFDDVAITLKLIEKRPYTNGVQVEGMWVDAKMVNYVFYSRFDVYEGGVKQETLETVQHAVIQAIGCGAEIPDADQEVMRLRNELAKLEADKRVVDENSNALIESLREQNESLKKALEDARTTHGTGENDKKRFEKFTEMSLIAARAAKEADIYKELYNNLLAHIIGISGLSAKTGQEQPEATAASE